MVLVDSNISAFRKLEYSRVYSLVLTSPEIPMGVIPKGQHADTLRYFDISEIEKLKGVFPCNLKSQNPDGCNPKRSTRGHVTVFQHFKNWNTQGCIPLFSQVPKS
jgi:hypothetical protein